MRAVELVQNVVRLGLSWDWTDRRVCTCVTCPSSRVVAYCQIPPPDFYFEPSLQTFVAEHVPFPFLGIWYCFLLLAGTRVVAGMFPQSHPNLAGSLNRHRPRGWGVPNERKAWYEANFTILVPAMYM